MPFINHNHAAIHYSDHGQGSPVLLIHGGLFEPIDAERFWQRPGIVQDLLSHGLRIILPDRRLHAGRTTTTFTAHSWQLDAADMAHVLQDARVEQAHIVAGSNGCSTALRLALSQPSIVRSLVLCWPAAPHNDELREAFAAAADLVEQIGPSSYVDRLRQRDLAHPKDRKALSPWDTALLRDDQLVTSFCYFSPQDAADLMRSSTAALLIGDLLRGVSAHEVSVLAKTGIPVTIMPSEPSHPSHPLATAFNLQKHIPGASMVRGFPPSPTPHFAAFRDKFSSTLAEILYNVEKNEGG